MYPLIFSHVHRSKKSPPFKKERSEEKEKRPVETEKAKTKVKVEKSSPKSAEKKGRKSTSTKTEKTPAKKSPAKKSPSKKSSPKNEDVSKFFKKETSTNTSEADVDMKDVAKKETDQEASGNDEGADGAGASPSKADKPINPFFTSMKKELKVQSVGAGLKGADYSPDKLKYHPIKDAFWNHGEK